MSKKYSDLTPKSKESISKTSALRNKKLREAGVQKQFNVTCSLDDFEIISRAIAKAGQPTKIKSLVKICQEFLDNE